MPERKILLKKPALILALSCTGLILGCDPNGRHRGAGPTAAATTQPATGAAGAGASLAKAAQVPAAASLVIDQRQQWFPPAMLRLTRSHGIVIARLYSNDPSAVLSGDASNVNSFDFLFPLPSISNPADISKAAYTAHSYSESRQETPYGIFLNDQQDILQPQDAMIRFSGKPPHVAVLVQGSFWMFHNDESLASAPTSVKVLGVLQATVPQK